MSQVSTDIIKVLKQPHNSPVILIDKLIVQGDLNYASGNIEHIGDLTIKTHYEQVKGTYEELGNVLIQLREYDKLQTQLDKVTILLSQSVNKPSKEKKDYLSKAKKCLDVVIPLIKLYQDPQVQLTLQRLASEAQDWVSGLMSGI